MSWQAPSHTCHAPGTVIHITISMLCSRLRLLVRNPHQTLEPKTKPRKRGRPRFPFGARFETGRSSGPRRGLQNWLLPKMWRRLPSLPSRESSRLSISAGERTPGQIGFFRKLDSGGGAGPPDPRSSAFRSWTPTSGCPCFAKSLPRKTGRTWFPLACGSRQAAPRAEKGATELASIFQRILHTKRNPACGVRFAKSLP